MSSGLQASAALISMTAIKRVAIEVAPAGCRALLGMPAGSPWRRPWSSQARAAREEGVATRRSVYQPGDAFGKRKRDRSSRYGLLTPFCRLTLSSASVAVVRASKDLRERRL